MRRAVFLDRDGVINRKAAAGKYVTRWEEMQILPGVATAIGRLNRAAFLVIVVSNQRCVAKGLITPAELDALHERLREKLAREGASIDAIYYCPHERYPLCGCRKPAPGMLFGAARAHGVDLSRSWMIGDSEADVAAGRNAGSKTALLGTRPERGRSDGDLRNADLRAPSLVEAVRQILKLDKVPSNLRARKPPASRSPEHKPFRPHHLA
jgi:D-glycero-D-manno-heptose 1,7-bisphosphate phosphatase